MLVLCQEILDEFEEKLLIKFAYAPEKARAVVEEVRSFSSLVPLAGAVQGVAADPDDDKILECAIIGGAKYIVTGDRHLLSLGNYRGIQIVRAADFLAIASAP
jgi:predicted nucleic acid-binding protein